MDIDDILREVDPTSNSIPAATRDLQALTRAWVAERSAPELLEFVATFGLLTISLPGPIADSTSAAGRAMASSSASAPPSRPRSSASRI